MVTVDMLPPHTHMLPPPTDTAMDTPAQLTPMVTVDTPPPHTHMLPPHTDTAMDTPAQLTPTVTVLSTSVMPRLSQRLMLTTGTTTTMESQPTVHMIMELTGPTGASTPTAAHLPTHTVTKVNT